MKRNEELDEGGAAVAANNGAVSGKAVRTYSRPKIISAEDLEAAAATCSGGAFGKTVPVPCGALGS